MPKTNVEPPVFSIQRPNQIIEISVPMVKNSQWQQWAFFCGDQHFDSTHCDRQLLTRDFEKCIERQAIIFSVGDWYDVMCGRHDPRGTKSELRPEYLKSDYFASITEDSSNFLKRYAKNIAVMIHGNHETSCIKNNEYDITRATVNLTNAHAKSKIMAGEYEEFVRLSFVPPKNNKCKEMKYSKMIYMYHGSGGAAPVTGGVIDNQRTAEYVRSDFIHMGHTHTTYVDARTYWEPTNKGNILEKTQHFLRTGSYKKSREPGTTTWETVKNIKPKRRGGIWVRFFYETACPQGLRFEIVLPDS